MALTDKKLKLLHLSIVVTLAGESNKSIRRFFNDHKPTKARAGADSAKSLARFHRKSRIKKILFLLKKDYQKH